MIPTWVNCMLVRMALLMKIRMQMEITDFRIPKEVFVAPSSMLSAKRKLMLYAEARETRNRARRYQTVDDDTFCSCASIQLSAMLVNKLNEDEPSPPPCKRNEI